MRIHLSVGTHRFEIYKKKRENETAWGKNGQLIIKLLLLLLPLLLLQFFSSLNGRHNLPLFSSSFKLISLLMHTFNAKRIINGKIEGLRERERDETH